MDSPMPKKYIIGNVSRDGDSFFNSVAQCLEQMREGIFSAKMLRQECKKYAQHCVALVDAIGGQNIQDYIAKIEYGENESQNLIMGRPEVEGRIINKLFKVNINVIEDQGSDILHGMHESKSWLIKMVEESSYGHIDYDIAGAIYIIKDGDLNFKPILKINSERCSDSERGDCVEDFDDQSETYELRKGTSGAGGHFYEIKLLMLLLLRLQITDKFYLAKNMAKVGAFDDAVFKYQIKDKDGTRMSKTIFLQAKHGDKSEGGCITLDSLLSPKGAFSLKKYLESYREIMSSFKPSNDPIFNGKFDDCTFVIFTNYILEPLPTNGKGIGKYAAKHISNPDRWITKEADGIVIAKGKESKLLNINADINRDIITKLSCSPLQQLAQEIYNCIFGDKQKEGIRNENEIFKEYHICLANEVFTVNRNKPSDSKFSSTFVEGNKLWNELYQIAHNLQCITKDEFCAKLKAAKVNLFKTFGNLQLSLEIKIFENVVVELANIIGQRDSNFLEIGNPSKGIMQLANNVLERDDVSDNVIEWVQFCRIEKLTGQAKQFMKKLTTKLAEISGSNDSRLTKVRFSINGFPKFSLPTTDEDVTDKEVKQFLSKLEFALGQAKENDLDDVIKKEIRESHQVKQEDVDIIYQSVKSQVESWWKTGNYFLTLGNKFVENARVSIAHFKLSSFENKRGVETDGVRFKETVVNKFKELIEQKQVVNIVADEGTTQLSSLKVCQTLEQTSGENSYIFVQVNHLLYIRDHILQIFQTDDTINFLVTENNIIYQKEIKWPKEDFNKLYNRLNKIIKSNKGKKVLLVTEEDDMLAKHFMHDTENCHTEHDNINLNHLTIPSQEKLMKNKVTLNGKRTKMRDLFGIRNANANSAITSKTIMYLIKKFNLIISNAPQCLSELDAAYTKLHENMPMENLVRELQNSRGKNTVFVFSGIKKLLSVTLHDALLNHLQITDSDLATDLRQRTCLYHERNDNKSIIIIGNTKEADLLKEFRQICSMKSDNIIYWLEITAEHVRLQQVYEPNFYIKRKFSYAEKNVLSLKLILQKNPTALFIFNAGDKEKLEKLTKTLNAEYQRRFKNNCERKTIRFARSELHAQKLFNELKGAKAYTNWIKINDNSKTRFIWHRSHGLAINAINKSIVFESDSQTVKDIDIMETRAVHWLQISGNESPQLTWMTSHGSFKQLRHYIDEHKSERKFYTEEQFIKEIQDKVVIIADEPGMGKSTNLTSVSQQMLDNNWVIHINFLDCENAIETLPAVNLNFEDVYNFVAKVKSAGLKNDLAKQLMLYKLDPKEQHCRPILLMFDGYDEISSKEQTKIIPLLQFIKWQTSAKLWVTTRLHMMDALENGFSAFATKFEPLMLEEQKAFLNKFWGVHLAPLLTQENIEEKIGKYSSMLLGASANIIGQTISKVMGVPLQLRLLAEGLMGDVTNFLNACDHQCPKFEHLNVLKLYQNFIDAKYEIYVREKIRIGKISPSIKSILKRGFDKHHETLAMHLLFSENNSPNYLKSFGDEVTGDLISVGIIQCVAREGTPYFIHRTFAEYFVAKFLVRCLKKKTTNPKKYKWTTQFLINHIFAQRNNVITEFMDHMLSEGSPIHIATLANKLSDVIGLTKDITQPKCVDDMGRTAMHLAAHDGHLNIVKVLLDSGYDSDYSDALGKTALHYATMNSHDEIIEHLLNCNADIDINDTVFATPLHADMEVGYNLFSDEYSRSSLVTFVNQKDIKGKTAFNYATENSDLEIACTLISHGANIIFQSKEQKREVLSHIFGKLHNTDYINIVGQLLLNYPVTDFLGDRDYEWERILCTFTELGHTNLMDVIMGNMASTNCFKLFESLTKNIKFKANFSDADNLKVAKYLFGKCNNVSVIRNLGASATRHGNLETVKYTLKHNNVNAFHDYMFGAIEHGQLNIVMYLLENNFKYITTDELNTALYKAVKYNRLGIVKYLVEKGADINARYEEGKTLMQYAASQDSTHIMSYLVKTGAPSNISGALAQTIEDYVEHCFTFYHNKLMQFDVMNSIKNISEVYPNVIGLTDFAKVTDIIMYQVQNDVNCRNEHGTALLHIAATFQTESLAKYLIKHGADVNIQDKEGRTPLHKAAKAYCQGRKNFEAIVCLLQHGATYDKKMQTIPLFVIICVNRKLAITPFVNC